YTSELLRNSAGYKEYRGQVLDSDNLDALITGLRSNSLLKYTHILTGYCGEKSFLEKILDVVTELKRASPNCLFLCDPVLGDDGKMYVPSELIDVYRERIVPSADILTPNQFELELLSGAKVTSEEEALKAIDCLLSRGSKCVIVTSIELPSSTDTLVLLGKSEKGEVARIEIPKLEGPFRGNWGPLLCPPVGMEPPRPTVIV
ncbi:Pyridoxal kinase, partial [Geodia barretti]